MFDKICVLISENLNVSKEKIRLDSDLQNDLGADSLDAVDLIMRIEDEFGVTIPDDEAQKLHTVKDIVAFLEQIK